MGKRFHKVLIANRGEIALRVIRTLKEMGIVSVAVYSDTDRGALHVRMADEAHGIGGTTAAESYLRQDVLIDVCQRCGADAIHPGYGFLSENPSFANAVREAGLVFIGPDADSITMMGEKTTARQAMKAAGVPVVPGTVDPIDDLSEALSVARTLGFPIMVKAAAGGGGKGMRLIHHESELETAIARARSEALNAFGNGAIYLEKYLRNPRHVEFQVLADAHGNVIHLNERECSVQRRHQKIVEETPSPVLTAEMRQRMANAAVKATRAANYRGAGTIEFLVDAERNFYFLEMNTRLQVEHPITELTHGIDLVREMVGIAQGEPLSIKQADVRPRGHAIECRIYAENPRNQFLPSPGVITHLREPSGPNVRVDSGVDQGSEVSLYYDPMVAKLVTWGESRSSAIQRMRRALAEYRVGGIVTNIEFLGRVLRHPAFLHGDYDTNFIERHWDELMPAPADEETRLRAIAAAIAETFASGNGTTTPAAAGKTPASAWTLLGRRRRLNRP